MLSHCLIESLEGLQHLRRFKQLYLTMIIVVTIDLI